MAGKVRIHISFTVRDEAPFILSASQVVKASQVRQPTLLQAIAFQLSKMYLLCYTEAFQVGKVF